MKAKIIDFQYEEGTFALTQGHKEYERERYHGDTHICPTGFGWATESSPSRLTITGQTKDGKFEVRVDTRFRDRGWERMTKRRVSAIRRTCPKQIEVEDVSVSDVPCYIPTEAAMDAWFAAAEKERG